MSMLKLDHETRPRLELEHLDSRAHYEDVVARTLLSMRRHWRLVASVLTLVLALAFAILPLLPRKYSATALVYPKLFSSEQDKSVARASIDGSSIVIGEARLIVSDAILHAVVNRLGPKTDVEAARLPSWMSQELDRLRAMFFPETRNLSPFDRRVALLRNKMKVMKDTRSYLISISFTARSAEEATRVVNAVALEYLRDKSIQHRQDAVTAAEAELAQQLAIYGVKHPKVLRATDRLAAARAAWTTAASPEGGGKDTIVADQRVVLAMPNHTPTSPKGSVVLGLASILGLLAGVGLAVWRDRGGRAPRQRLHTK